MSPAWLCPPWRAPALPVVAVGRVRAVSHCGMQAWSWGFCQGMWHEKANPWRGQRLCCSWGLTRAVSVPCLHRWCPQHLLLQLPEAAHPSAPCQLRLRHQQLLYPAGRDVSTQHCQQCQGSWGHTGTHWDTLRVLLEALTSRCPSPAAQGRFFLPAVWSPRRRSRCVQIHRHRG